MGEPLIVSLSELAGRVQRGRTTDQVLEIAGQGMRRLGLRLVAFQIDGDAMVLRYVATAARRLRAIEALVGRPLCGLRAPLARWNLVRQVIIDRRNIYREDLDVFQRFLVEATGHDLAPLDASPATAGVANGVLAPLFVRDRPWGLLAVYSPDFRAEDAAAVALFATHVGSALEAAKFIEELVRREHLAALGELSAIVAHEVRNPLGAIFNALALLKHVLGSREDHASQLLSIVAEEAERLNEIVSDLLDFARPTGPSLQRASIRAIAEEVLAVAHERPEAARTDLRLDVPSDLPGVDMDVRLVRQALLNLVLNSLQAMSSGGVLTLRGRIEEASEPHRAFVRLDVIDTGPGIPPDQHPRVFEPFFTTKATGTGLGLPLVKRVVEAHGGDVGLESGPRGTTFSLRLPLPRPSRRGRGAGALSQRSAPQRRSSGAPCSGTSRTAELPTPAVPVVRYQS